ncbi:MAG TPA: hypothetical protein PLB10_13835 [Thiolinea sp.]|nr:hypothetical protein [Thiolinea sp.]
MSVSTNDYAFRNLAGTLCGLSHGTSQHTQPSGKADNCQSAIASPRFSATTNTSLTQGLSGFQQSIGQRYPSSGQSGEQLIRLFTEMLNTLMQSVINNSAADTGPVQGNGNNTRIDAGSTVSNVNNAGIADTDNNASASSASNAAKGGCPFTGSQTPPAQGGKV